MKDKFPIIEMFGPTLQGEGPMIGVRTHFIRFAGCPYRCTWCDSFFAVLPEEIKKNATRMTAAEIATGVKMLDNSDWITLTGGDPVMYDIDSVVDALGDYKLSVETEGYLWRDWLNKAEQVVVNPKAPSSGMSDKTNWEILHKYEAICAHLKIVIFDNTDLDWAEWVAQRYPSMKLYLSVGTPQGLGEDETQKQVLCRLHDLSNEVLKRDKLSTAILLPQQHVLTWGTQQGV